MEAAISSIALLDAAGDAPAPLTPQVGCAHCPPSLPPGASLGPAPTYTSRRRADAPHVLPSSSPQGPTPAKARMLREDSEDAGQAMEDEDALACSPAPADTGALEPAAAEPAAAS